MSKYRIHVKQSGNHSTSIVGDHTQLISNFNALSSVQDLIKVLKAIRKEIEVMDIPADVKEKANLEVGRAIIQAKKEKPDKPKLLESLKNTATLVTKSASIAVGVGKFWTLLRKAIAWLS